ncbi:hypothetical protein A33Q_0038 [Indibacter alkaliphilus LW1]|uniref:Uncharacterized protein n=1 Tax=Indibacter alkaliphilus (strain CCUG 57479 / KCTC 22604 / LW1) TaxID=1189612 RepID=S2DND0_INDAL|nr:hypothetical protein A33Q_0038 [Indibacter alkaliphilus LW1]
MGQNPETNKEKLPKSIVLLESVEVMDASFPVLPIVDGKLIYLDR